MLLTRPLRYPLARVSVWRLFVSFLGLRDLRALRRIDSGSSSTGCKFPAERRELVRNSLWERAKLLLGALLTYNRIRRQDKCTKLQMARGCGGEAVLILTCCLDRGVWVAPFRVAGGLGRAAFLFPFGGIELRPCGTPQGSGLWRRTQWMAFAKRGGNSWQESEATDNQKLAVGRNEPPLTRLGPRGGWAY